MPTVTFEHENYTGTVRSHTVYAKTRWSDSWTEQSHIICTSAKWTAAPQVASAQMYYRYGHGIIPGNASTRYLNRYTLPTLAYVKIVFDVTDITDPTGDAVTRTWYGVVGSLVDQIGGSMEFDGNAAQQGQQQLNAVGLEWLLDRHYITSTWYTNYEEDAAPTKGNVGMGFNLPLRRSDTLTSLGTVSTSYPSKNRTVNLHTLGTEDTFIFLDHAEDNENWSTRDIVQYLLAAQTPRLVDDTTDIKWQLLDAENLVPDWDAPKLQQHGFRVWQLLNQVMARQRCLGFTIEVDEEVDPAVIQVVPFTFTASDITVPGTTNAIKANPYQTDVDVTNDLTANPITSVDAFAKYDQVRVTGARAIHVCTLKIGDGIAKSWSSSLESEYESGAQSESNYPASTEIGDRNEADKSFRDSTKFQHVFRSFKLDPDWDLKTADDYPAFPTQINLAPELYEPREYLFDSIYVVPIPFSADGTSYNENPHACKFITYNTTTNRFIDGELIQGLRFKDGEEEGQNFAWRAAIRNSNFPGEFDLLVGGQPKHIIDSANFTFLSWDPQLGADYDLTESLFTLGLTADYFCESRYPDDSSLSASTDLHRIRHIDAGPDYRLVFLVNSTTLYVKSDGSRYQSGSSHYIIDDRDTLLEIATQAHAWYGRDRAAVSFKTGLVTDGLSIGDMITDLIEGSVTQSVNTVVTSIMLTHSISSGSTVEPPRIEYTTEHADFDFLSFATQR